MGQYYYPVILSENGGKIVGSFFAPRYGSGLKLMEHSYLGVPFMDAVVAKAMAASVAKSKPITLAWLGDYANLKEDIHTGYFVGQNRDYDRIFLKAQRIVRNGLYRVQPDDPDVLHALRYANDAVFYDVIRREKLSLSAYRKAQTIKYSGRNVDPTDFVHPISLLTAIGNGKGGGDYDEKGLSCKEWVGKWALHPLWVVPEGVPDPEGDWTDISATVLFDTII